MAGVGIRGVGMRGNSLAGVIRRLFANNEQGAWYDPQDYGTSGTNGVGTLYQDSAGTTPVTAVEQPVGLMLDKRKGIPTITELLTNNDFATDTIWSKGTGWSIAAGVATKVAGSASSLTQPVTVTTGTTYRVVYTITRTAGTITPQLTGGSTVSGTSRSASGTYVDELTAVSGNVTFGFSADASFAGTVDNVYLKRVAGNDAYQTTSAARPTLRARYNLLVGTATLSTQSITTVAANYTLTFTGSGSITLSGTATGTYTAGTSTFTATAGALTVTVTGTVNNADIRPTNQIGTGLPSYQRVTTSTDYDTVGFPVYIQGNGSSQFMLTSSIDFSATDKMTVWAGVRKLSDAATSVVAELSTIAGAGNPGSFNITAPNTAAATTYGFRTGGSVSVGVNSGAGVYASPITNVLTMTGDISGDALGGRINGTTVASSALDQGTGNFGNYALYLLARAGASIWFGGYFYGAIIRGAATSDSDIRSGERYLNQRVKAY